MDNLKAENNNSSAAKEIIYPPKFIAEEVKDGSVWIRTLRSMLLYLVIGFLLTWRLDILIVIIAIIFLHEIGHFLAMKFYNYADVGIFFIPLFGALASGTKREVSQKQTAVILLAGPLPGIVLGLLLYFIDETRGGVELGKISLNLISLLLIWINILNLLPIFPLDGGQLLNRVFLDEEGFWSNAFVAFSAIGVIWLAIATKIYLLLIVPAMMIRRYLVNRKYILLEKKLIAEGLDLDKEFEDLTDEEYWRIRKVIVQNIAAFSRVDPGPPFKYQYKEDLIADEVETSLQRNLLIDITTTEKIIVIVVWAVAIASPWIFDIEFFGNFFKW